MVQVIYKDGKAICVTTVPYDERTVRSMKRAGYKVKEVENCEPDPYMKNAWFRDNGTDK